MYTACKWCSERLEYGSKGEANMLKSVKSTHALLPKLAATAVAALQLLMFMPALLNREEMTTQQHWVMPLLAVAAAAGLMLGWVELRLGGWVALLLAGALLLTSAYYNPPAMLLSSALVLFAPVALPAIWLLWASRQEPDSRSTSWQYMVGLYMVGLLVVLLSAATLFAGVSVEQPLL